MIRSLQFASEVLFEFPLHYSYLILNNLKFLSATAWDPLLLSSLSNNFPPTSTPRNKWGRFAPRTSSLRHRWSINWVYRRSLHLGGEPRMRWISGYRSAGFQDRMVGIGCRSRSLEWFYGKFGKHLVFQHHTITRAYP